MIYSWNIIGHEAQCLSLEKSLQDEGSLSHAYLFFGPSDVGKWTVAQFFSKILLCDENFCHQCVNCHAVESGVHPDLVKLLDEGGSIKIDSIRQLIQKVSQTSQGKRRVVLIENIDRMPVEAQNAFLKTLEEPPGETIFLLTSSHPKKILPTIISRVRSVEFGLVDNAFIQSHLETMEGVDAGQIRRILEMAQGRPGLAIRLAKDPLEFAAYRDLFYQIEAFLSRNDLIEKFKYVESIEKNPEALEQFFEVFSLLLRKLTYDFLEGESHPLKKRFSSNQLADLFDKFIETRYLIQRNVNKKLALENFFLLTEV